VTAVARTEPVDTRELKAEVRDYWEREPCGTRDLDDTDRERFFAELERRRRTLEPYVAEFAHFERGGGRDVLEIGTGPGTDLLEWSRHGARAIGIDITQAGASLASEHLRIRGETPRTMVADAERLPFADGSFDIVYSFGVLHHTPDTERAIAEARRVLRPGGTALVMLYRYWSWTGIMLWLIWGLARLRPWLTPRRAIYEHLESHGTKSYSVAEARRLFAAFSSISMRTQVGHGDLALARPGARYEHALYRLAWRLYPRWLVRLTGNALGLFLLIEARK
jgi:SAM-dependent methyltransferase